MDTDFWRRVLSKRPWLRTYRHRVEFQKVSVFSNTSVRTSNVAFPKSIFQLITGLIPCSRQGACSFGCWICNGNVTLLSALVCTQPVVCNHTRWNRRDKQQSRVAVVNGPLCFYPFWMAKCHYKLQPPFTGWCGLLSHPAVTFPIKWQLIHIAGLYDDRLQCHNNV